MTSEVESARKTIYEKKGHIAYLTINYPEKANIMSNQVIQEMGDAYRDFWMDREMRVMILTAVGERHFSGGHHIQPPPPGMTVEDVRHERGDQVVWPAPGSVNGRKPSVDPHSGHDFPQIFKPVIAAVNGIAAGAGLYTLLTTADIRIACAEHGRFYYALLSNRGGIGSGPAPTRILKQINYVNAMKFLLMDEPIDAQEAVRIGLINEAVPHDQLMTRAEEIAQRIASLPPISVRFLKEFLIRAQDMTTDQAWHLQFMFHHLASIHSADSEDSTTAFLEKRGREITGGLRDCENHTHSELVDGYLPYDPYG